ncbi:MAG: hypothetical protein AB1679_20910 [Actinomycetota bacterium]
MFMFCLALVAVLGMAVGTTGAAVVTPLAATGSEAAAEETAAGEETAPHRRARSPQRRKPGWRARRQGPARVRRRLLDLWWPPLAVPTSCSPRRGPPTVAG